MHHPSILFLSISLICYTPSLFFIHFLYFLFPSLLLATFQPCRPLLPCITLQKNVHPCPCVIPYLHIKGMLVLFFIHLNLLLDAPLMHHFFISFCHFSISIFIIGHISTILTHQVQLPLYPSKYHHLNQLGLRDCTADGVPFSACRWSPFLQAGRTLPPSLPRRPAHVQYLRDPSRQAIHFWRTEVVVPLYHKLVNLRVCFLLGSPHRRRHFLQHHTLAAYGSALFFRTHPR